MEAASTAAGGPSMSGRDTEAGLRPVLRTQLLFAWRCVLLAILYGVSLASSEALYTLVTPNPTPEAQGLANYLKDHYGRKMISGQMDMKYQGRIVAAAGKDVALYGFDFDGIRTDGSQHGDVQKASDWVVGSGGIATFSWHWKRPDGQGDYYSLGFPLQAALDDTSQGAGKQMVAMMHAVARQLEVLQARGIPVLWRPMHEAEGKWFWWGAHGGDNLKRLWKLMFEMYTRQHGLRNLIWVWNSYVGEHVSASGDWYPGDDMVDMIAYDYPRSTSWNDYNAAFDREKLFGIGEVGKFPDPADFARAPWSYFLCWAYYALPPGQCEGDGKCGQNSDDWVRTVLNDPRTITLVDVDRDDYRTWKVGPPGPRIVRQPSTLRVAAGIAALPGALDLRTVFLDDRDGTNLAWSIAVSGNSAVTATVGATGLVDLAIASGATGKAMVEVRARNRAGGETTARFDLVIRDFSGNLALFQPAAGSSQDAYAQGPSAVVDGDAATRWSSAYKDGEWIGIDLDTVLAVDSVVLRWEDAYASAYDIEVSSDGASWKLARAVAGGKGGVERVKFAPVAARHVRVVGKARSTEYGISLWEFEVYRTRTTVAVAPRLPAAGSRGTAMIRRLGGVDLLRVAVDGGWTAIVRDARGREVDRFDGSGPGEAALRVGAAGLYEVEVRTGAGTHRAVGLLGL